MGFGDRDYYRPTGVGGFTFFPPVIKKLLIINAAVFFLQIISQNIVIGNSILENQIIKYFGLIPLNYDAASFYPWQLISYQFLHGGFSHILFNMFLLWMFGMELENMWGSQKFLLYYLLCGIGAGLVQLLFSQTFSGGAAPTIGASGAVFGVMIAFAMFFPDRYIYLYFLIPVKAKYLIAFLVVIEFMSVGNMSFVAHLAHIGGAVSGFILITLDRRYRFNVAKWFSSINFGRGKGTLRATLHSGNHPRGKYLAVPKFRMPIIMSLTINQNQTILKLLRKKLIAFSTK